MKTLRSPSTPGSDTDHAVLRAAALLSLILLIVGPPATADESKAAVWKVTEVGFSYRSSVAVYSCSALRDRVTSILRAIGARDDVDVKVTNCDSFEVPTIGPSQEPGGVWRTPSDSVLSRTDSTLNRRTDRGQLAGVRVRLMMPTEVTPEILAEIDRDKSRRELVSRVTGNPAAALNDPVVFPAQRQTITLSHRSIGLEPEECELLDQISAGVFRQLGVRVVRRNFTCDRNHVSRIAPELTVEAFVGVPFGIGTPVQPPAAGENNPDPTTPAASDPKPAEPATAPPRE